MQRGLLLSTVLLNAAVAQQCYYPSGDPSVEPDAPCNASSGPLGNCCPLNWQCLSNGLCSNPNANLMQRTTCTDENWGSSCSNICTYGGTAIGNEAILKCANGRYCCDRNRINYNCCNDPNGISFNLQDGSQVAFISSVNTAGNSGSSPTAYNGPSAQATQNTNQNLQSSTPTVTSTIEVVAASAGRTTLASVAVVTPSTVATSGFVSFTSNAQSSTSVFTSTSAGSVVVVTSVVSASYQPQDTSPPSPTPSPSSHTDIGAIVGGVVGGVGGLLLLLAAAALLLWRRRRSRKHRDQAAAGMASNPMCADDGGEPKPQGPHEIDGTGVGWKSAHDDTSPGLPSYSPATTNSQGLANSPAAPYSPALGRGPYELHGGSMQRAELPGGQHR